MTSPPTFVKVGKNPAILEKQAVNVFILAFLWTVDFFQLVTFCDFKKMRIQKLLNRVEKYRWIFLWTTRHKGKWFFFNIFHWATLIFFPVCYFYGMFCASSKFEWCGVEEVGSGSFSYVKKDTKSKCRMVVFFIKIYKQVIIQHERIVSPVQSGSGKALVLIIKP